MRSLYTRGATPFDASSCTREPLLHIIVVMWMLHFLIGMGKYITKFLPMHATRLTPHQRNKAEKVINKAKTNMA